MSSDAIHTNQTKENTLIKFITHADIINEHEAILQMLERELDGNFMSADSFTSSVNDWNGTPIVFAKEHPELEDFSSNRDLELQRIDGRIVGYVSKPEVVLTGHPHFKATLVFKNAPDVEQLWAQGKLSLSTAFECHQDKNKRLVGPTIPNHVLVFVEDGLNMPKDKAALIFKATQGDKNMSEEEKNVEIDDGIVARIKAGLSELLKLITGGEEETPETQDAPPVEEKEQKDEPKIDEKKDEKPIEASEVSEDAKKIQELQNEVAETTKALEDALSGIQKANTEIKARDEKLTVFEDEKKVLAQKQKDAEWEAIKNKIPAGIVKDTASEIKARKEFEEEPAKFLNSILGLDKPDIGKKVGKEFTQSESQKSKSGGVGEFDVKTKNYKEK